MKSLHKEELDKYHAARWRSYPSMQRWAAGLLDVTGLTAAQIANRLDTLFQFCLQHKIDPEVMAEECRKSEERVARRAFYLEIAGKTPANLVVQSFLVHNGVNVFGDLVCMPSTREQIVAEQGDQWIQESKAADHPSLHKTERKP